MTTTPEVLACDVEPIHVPGATQPHGVLVALDPRSLHVTQVSANCAQFFDAAPEDVLGRPLSALVGDSADALLEELRSARMIAGEPLFANVRGLSCDVRAHRHQGVMILEFERHDLTASASDAALRGALARLQRPTSISEICAIAVEEICMLTGFDRVLVYRFDDDGHGDVLDEARADGVDSYRGLRFPAADIPRQAREMYLLNWLRLIPDARYSPVPLVPQLRPDTGAPLDLSFATLRSVSPVHLEYLQNMGVSASMSVSLVRGERLWGLIACHHRSPRHVSFAARSACEVLGRVVSLQIAALEEIEVRTTRSALAGVEAKLVDAMRDAQEDSATGLIQRGDALLALVGASGAAVCTDARIRTVGATPSSAQLAALVAWLGKEGSSAILHTDALAERHPPAAEYAHVASGLLALTLPGVTLAYVIWFRPEMVRTVNWAGDPTKTVEVSVDGSRYHPRHSFEAWKQVVRARARPWRLAEIEAAEDLRRRAIELDLAKQITRAEEAVHHRDEMVAILSHDLKNPLNVIQLSAAVVRQQVSGDARAENAVKVVERAVGRMNSLILNLLDLAKIEAGRFELSLQPYLASRLVTDAFVTLAPLAESKSIRLTCDDGGDASVHTDAERFFQVLSNLVGNAIKFTPAGGAVTVSVLATEREVRFAVRDTGPGIVAVELAHIFDRYWQARRGSSAGAGLGLYIAKGIVEAHGGRIWAESTVGHGATFYFALPSDRERVLEPASDSGS